MNISVCAYDYMGNCVLHTTTCLYFATVLKLFLLHNQLSGFETFILQNPWTMINSDEKCYGILCVSFRRKQPETYHLSVSPINGY